MAYNRRSINQAGVRRALTVMTAFDMLSVTMSMLSLSWLKTSEKVFETPVCISDMEMSSLSEDLVVLLLGRAMSVCRLKHGCCHSCTEDNVFSHKGCIKRGP